MRPTTTWRKGEIIEDLHTIQLPAGLDDTSLSVFAGMYEIADPDIRLTMTAAGEAVPENAWKLGTLSSLAPDQP
jgi:hypothetical protein